ncbi:MAG: hypothetical protein UHT92_02610 [Prevotella sp.]|nr:hypothetical protein [Prevotella sp.]
MPNQSSESYTSDRRQDNVTLSPYRLITMQLHALIALPPRSEPHNLTLSLPCLLAHNHATSRLHSLASSLITMQLHALTALLPHNLIASRSHTVTALQCYS